VQYAADNLTRESPHKELRERIEAAALKVFWQYHTHR